MNLRALGQPAKLRLRCMVRKQLLVTMELPKRHATSLASSRLAPPSIEDARIGMTDAPSTTETARCHCQNGPFSPGSMVTVTAAVPVHNGMRPRLVTPSMARWQVSC